MVLVWKNGTGQASFQFNVKDGKSDIQLGFSLGSPDDAHLSNLHQMPRRHKSHRRQERDRKRAAVYQARMQSHHQSEQDSAVPAESPSHEPRSVSDEVVMVESQEEVIPIESESLPIVPPSTLTSAVSVESGGVEFHFKIHSYKNLNFTRHNILPGKQYLRLISNQKKEKLSYPD